MIQEIYILDLIGTFTFAVYGSYFALKKDFDVLGIFVCAFLTAVGGGTIRELILGNVPFYFFDDSYILAIIFATIFTILIYRMFHRIKRFALVLDSIGLVTFAFIGASKASDMGLGIFAITFCATITAVGGGMLRDIVLGKVPEIMHRDFYASVAIILGVIYALADGKMTDFLWANLLIFSCLAIRLVAVFLKVDLWKPKKQEQIPV
jgi:uncharacterized membrane protein YeiH